MNIQRKYSLPNCTLLLEGLSEAVSSPDLAEMRPELSILVNAECRFSGYPQPLSGGREFFESLVRAVSGYAQEILSNVPNPQAHNQHSELVQLQRISANQHRLIVHSDTVDGFEFRPNHNEPTVQMDLNTVQLFDLVEAVDQFFADSQTMPELSLELHPVSRGYSGTSQSIRKEMVPASIGIISIAFTAIALSLVPAPEVKPPQPEKSESTSSLESQTSDASGKSPHKSQEEQPTKLTPVPEPSPQSVANTPNQPVVKNIEAIFNTVTEIVDSSQLRTLTRQVYNQINPAWENRSVIKEDLVYRLGVAADGAILGYKPVNPSANQQVNSTPLPQLLYNPIKRPPIHNEPIAQFRVVFTGKGVLQVSPWRGYAETPDVIGTKITEPNTLNNLRQKLDEMINRQKVTTSTYKQDLLYRVAINNDAIIADYEPLNQPAFDYFRETPLPKMFQEVYGSNGAPPNNQEPMAHFRVTFKPNGKLEITPWQGY